MLKSSKKHLLEAKENYLKHMINALKISIIMISGGLMALIHSIFPVFFTKGASSKITKLYLMIEKRKQSVDKN